MVYTRFSLYAWDLMNGRVGELLFNFGDQITKRSQMKPMIDRFRSDGYNVILVERKQTQEHHKPTSKIIDRFTPSYLYWADIRNKDRYVNHFLLEESKKDTGSASTYNEILYTLIGIMLNSSGVIEAKPQSIKKVLQALHKNKDFMLAAMEVPQLVETYNNTVAHYNKFSAGVEVFKHLKYKLPADIRSVFI